MIPPGSTIGILGGGQLGRMIALAGRRMGYRFHVYDPSPTACAASVADHFVNAEYDDTLALDAFAAGVDVVTLEFENVPIEALQQLECLLPVRPNSHTLGICQNREAEKNFLHNGGYPCAPFAVIDSFDSLTTTFAEFGAPCVLKTAAFGYDGKGQVKIRSASDLKPAWEKLGEKRAVLEKWIQFEGEFSIICARNRRGETAVFPIAENIHTHHILDISVVPARIEPSAKAEAEKLACAIMDDLGTVGLLAVELFYMQDGSWLVNELAPRPHNSGHYTYDACITSQFEQHVRAVCDAPLGSTELIRPVAMVNLLGNAWHQQQPPNWEMLLRQPDLKLHLYDKGEAKPDRKMGHFCVFGETAFSAFERAKRLRDTLLQNIAE